MLGYDLVGGGSGGGDAVVLGGGRGWKEELVRFLTLKWVISLHLVEAKRLEKQLEDDMDMVAILKASGPMIRMILMALKGVSQ